MGEILWSISRVLEKNQGVEFVHQKEFVKKAVDSVHNKWDRFVLDQDLQHKVALALLVLGADHADIAKEHVLIPKLQKCLDEAHLRPPAEGGPESERLP